MTRTLTYIGDANDIHTWSGIPYHFLQAGRRANFLDCGWTVRPQLLRKQRVYWNLREFLATGRRGGFQYSSEFLQRLFNQIPPGQRDGEIISHFPLFPPAGSVRGPVSFYIDLTLHQLFTDYGFDKIVGSRIVSDALSREADAYHSAERIVCMSRWTARVAMERYKLAADRVHVVPAGANLDETRMTDLREDLALPNLQPLRLGFLGKDFRRKNLAFVLDVAGEIQARGYRVEVAAAGFDPKKGPRHPLLRSFGFLDKQHRFESFTQFIRSCHFGCLFSKAEGYGISNREFIRLGIPVITWDVGGMAETVPEGLGHVFSAGSAASAVADWLEHMLADPARYLALRDRVRARAAEVSWDRTIERLQAIWAGSHETK